jgi:hypothetical protein
VLLLLLLLFLFKLDQKREKALDSRLRGNDEQERLLLLLNSPAHC